MGLLERTNPHATPKSVLRHAGITGIVGGVVYLVLSIWKPNLRDVWPILLPVWVLLCADVGGLYEWQVDDVCDLLESEDETTPHKANRADETDARS